jgi:hypothetical protein
MSLSPKTQMKGEPSMVIYYCPRGCQQCAGDDLLDLVCGKCGSVMTKDSTGHDAIHEALIQEQIAEMGKQSRT